MGSKMMRAVKFAMLLLGLLSLGGCVSSGWIHNASPITCAKPFDLDLILVKATSSFTDVAAEKQMLNDAITSGLRDTHLFQAVGENREELGSGSGILIEAHIIKIKKVSKNKRLWAGALAGRARISVEVMVSDLNTGKPMETFEVGGESSGGSALAGTTQEAIDRAAEGVVAEVLKINSETAE
jgi:hypothetical protein